MPASGQAPPCAVGARNRGGPVRGGRYVSPWPARRGHGHCCTAAVAPALRRRSEAGGAVEDRHLRRLGTGRLGTGTWDGCWGQAAGGRHVAGLVGTGKYGRQVRKVLSAAHSASVASHQPPWPSWGQATRGLPGACPPPWAPGAMRGASACPRPVATVHVWAQARAQRLGTGTNAGTNAIATEDLGGEAPAAERRSYRELFAWGQVHVQVHVHYWREAQLRSYRHPDRRPTSDNDPERDRLNAGTLTNWSMWKSHRPEAGSAGPGGQWPVV